MRVSLAHCSNSFSALTRIIETIQSNLRRRWRRLPLRCRTSSAISDCRPSGAALFPFLRPTLEEKLHLPVPTEVRQWRRKVAVPLGCVNNVSIHGPIPSDATDGTEECLRASCICSRPGNSNVFIPQFSQEEVWPSV